MELIEGHAQTPFHAVRFGGGLPCRPQAPSPPKEHDATESHYIRQLFDAYGSHLGITVNNASDLKKSLKPRLHDDLLRQRERFYSAEALRNFARDNVPQNTFNRLQEDIFDGVIDICENDYNDGLARMKETIKQATQISLTSNPLSSVINTKDRQGICHQLANEDRLTWVPIDEEEENDLTI